MDNDSITNFPDPYGYDDKDQDFQGLQNTYGDNVNVSDGFYQNKPDNTNFSSQPMPQQGQIPYDPQPDPMYQQPYTPQNFTGQPPYQQPYNPQMPPQQMPYQQPNNPQYGQMNTYTNNNIYMNPSDPYSYPIPGKTVSNTAGLVCGIGSIITCWMPLAGLGAAIAGLCFSLKAKKESEKPGNRSDNLVIPGLICSIIGGVISLIISFFFIIGLIAVISNPQAYADDDYDYYDDYGYYEYSIPRDYT